MPRQLTPEEIESIHDRASEILAGMTCLARHQEVFKVEDKSGIITKYIFEYKGQRLHAAYWISDEELSTMNNGSEQAMYESMENTIWNQVYFRFGMYDLGIPFWEERMPGENA
jgi:hypothetical protein